MLRGRSCPSSALHVLCLPSSRSTVLPTLSLQALTFRRPKCRSLRMRSTRRPALALLTPTPLQDLSNNHVLVSVLTASLVGQALKPLTAALQGKGFNLKLLIASGGMPSSHSACVTAACTAIALERGLADPLFGMSVVFAGIVMYDAQGVRRAVGKQAEVINTIVVGSDQTPSSTSKKSFISDKVAELKIVDAAMIPRLSANEEQRKSTTMTMPDKQPSTENRRVKDFLTEVSSYQRSRNFVETAKKLPSVEAGDVNLQEIGDLDGWRHIPLKESVGHTKLEVLVGAAWGIICTLVLSNLIDLEFSQIVQSP